MKKIHVGLDLYEDDYRGLAREAGRRMMPLTVLMREKMGAKQTWLTQAPGRAREALTGTILSLQGEETLQGLSIASGRTTTEVSRFLDRMKYLGYLNIRPNPNRKKSFLYSLNEVGFNALSLATAPKD